MVGKLLSAARLFYCLLVRPLCVVEDILVLGEEGQTSADLRHCVLGDMLRMVGVAVDILEVGARFAVWAVDLVGEVEGHVEEVGDLGVGNSCDTRAHRNPKSLA